MSTQRGPNGHDTGTGSVTNDDYKPMTTTNKVALYILVNSIVILASFIRMWLPNRFQCNQQIKTVPPILTKLC